VKRILEAKTLAGDLTGSERMACLDNKKVVAGCSGDAVVRSSLKARRNRLGSFGMARKQSVGCKSTSKCIICDTELKPS